MSGDGYVSGASGNVEKRIDPDQSTMPVKDIASFLTMVRPMGWQCLVAITPDGKIVGKSFQMPDEVDAAAQWAIEQNQAGKNVYWSVNPVVGRIDKKPTKADIAGIEYQHADIDPDVTEQSYAEARKGLLNGRYQALFNNGLPPTFVIDSGNGIAPYWKVKGVPDIAAGEDINKRLIDAYGADPGTWNADRIMRLPFTLNYPSENKISKGYPAEPTRSSVLHQSGAAYTYDELAAVLPECKAPAGKRKSKAKAQTVVGFREDEMPMSEEESKRLELRFKEDRQWDPKLEARWQGDREGLNDTSRSALDMSMGALLKARGYSYREMREVLRNSKHGAGKEKYNVGNQRYFQRIWMNSLVGAADDDDAELDFQYVKDTLQAMHADGKLTDRAWSEFLYRENLKPAMIDRALDYLAKDLKIGGKRALTAEWKVRNASYSEQDKKLQQAEQRRQQCAGRTRIQWADENLNGMLLAAETAMLKDSENGDLLVQDTAYCRVVTALPDYMHRIDHDDEPPPAAPMLRLYDPWSMRLRVDKSCYFEKYQGPKTGNVPIQVPHVLAQTLIHNPDPQAPRVAGLVTHPLLLPDGRLLTAPGYDEPSGLYLEYGGCRFDDLPREVGLLDAELAANQILVDLFSEFQWFDKEIDATSALGLCLTTVLRKSIDTAPGFMATANIQGSGKTTLVRMVYVAASGHDMPAAIMPDHPEEARKAMLSLLLDQLPLTCFDNVPDGFEIHNSVLAAALTLPMFKDRVLGISKEISVPTNTVFAIAGNNIVVGADLSRRLVPCQLQPKEARPERRRFRHADVVSHALSVRKRTIRNALIITRAYLDADCPLDGESDPSGFPLWDRMVRLPIKWATGHDLLKAMDRARDESPEFQAMVQTVRALTKLYPYRKTFKAAEIARLFDEFKWMLSSQQRELRDAMSAMSSKAHKGNAKSIAWVLRKLLNRPTPAGTLRADQDRDHVLEYWVEA